MSDFEVPVTNEFQHRTNLIKVRAKLNSNKQLVPKVKKTIKLVNGKAMVVSDVVGWEEIPTLTKYREPMTEDLSTAFLSRSDRSLCSSLIKLMESVKDYANRRNYDLSDLYNYFCGLHDYVVVSSKATGEGAKISVRQEVIQKYMENIQDYRTLPEEEPASNSSLDLSQFGEAKKKYFKKRNFQPLV